MGGCHKNALMRHHCVALRMLLWLERHCKADAYVFAREVGTVE
jgi:hypothetical protein